MKKALITGIGQVSSYLSELLLVKGYEVYVLHRRYSHNHFVNFKTFQNSDRLHFICGDITDYSSVHNIVLKYEPDEIFNLAAQSHVSVSFEQPGLTFEVDAGGCINFLECLKNLQKTTPYYKPRLYQASTSELYGSSVSFNSPLGRVNANYKDLPKDFDYELFQDEETPFCPESPYAVAKLAAHQMCRLYRNSYGIFVSSSILFNTESPRRGEEFVTRKITKWIGEFVNWRDKALQDSYLFSYNPDKVFIHYTKGLEGKCFPKLRLGNLESFRDWSHAKDMVRGIWLTLQQDKADDYVLCSEQTNSIRNFLDIAFSKADIQDWSNLVVQDEKYFRPSEVPLLRGKCDKAREVLGWSPEYSFDELVTEMVESDIELARHG